MKHFSHSGSCVYKDLGPVSFSKWRKHDLGKVRTISCFIRGKETFGDVFIDKDVSEGLNLSQLKDLIRDRVDNAVTSLELLYESLTKKPKKKKSWKTIEGWIDENY